MRTTEEEAGTRADEPPTAAGTAAGSADSVPTDAGPDGAGLAAAGAAGSADSVPTEAGLDGTGSVPTESGPAKSGLDGTGLTESGAAGARRRLRGGWRPRRRTLAVAVLVLLLLASGGFLWAGQALRDPDATRNHALTDTAGTDQVIGDVSNALSRVFAYAPDDTESTAQAAHDLLAGAAATQYQKLFAEVRSEVAAQQLTLTTRVVRAGVVTLTADRARLLVFLDQTAQQAGAAATSAAAELSVTARLVDGRWRITDMTSR